MADETKTHAGKPDAVPGNDNAHAHSYAAHLHTEGKGHMSSEVIGKQGREPGSMKQPPQDPKLTGKTHGR